MDQPEQPRGNFVINLNFRRNGNSKAPPITGRISTPEAPDTEFSFSAFRHDGEKGAYWIGPVDTNRSMRQALNTQPTQGTNFVAIRENGFKVFKEHADGSPNAAYAALTKEQQEQKTASLPIGRPGPARPMNPSCAPLPGSASQRATAHGPPAIPSTRSAKSKLPRCKRVALTPNC